MEIASWIDPSFDAKGFWKGHDVRLSVTFLMSAVGILRASTLERPDDSIRIQARSEGPDPLLAPLSPLPPFFRGIIDRRFHERSDRTLAWLLIYEV